MGVAPTRKAIDLCRELLSSRGEVVGGRLASEVIAAYQALDDPARGAFFDRMAKEFSPDPQEVGAAGDAYRRSPSPENLMRLQQAVEAPRRELFRRMILAPNGLDAVVKMRAQLLGDRERNPLWTPIAADLAHLLTNWFNRGFLVLRRIDWRTSATVLEKLIQYEAVHQIVGWHDLRRRLEKDRRCYGYFHPALPDEPIIFIEAALTEGMSDNVRPLLDPDSPVLKPDRADTAIFYSITNCQEGLRGVPFGSFLIKQVAEDLGRELPRLRKFATLSPVPGFRAWLTTQATDVLAELDTPGWFVDQAASARLQERLMPLCAQYLLHAKHAEEPADPVARFHLRNGARLERINWLANTSEEGLAKSAGLMVNYVYRLNEMEGNHELYTRHYKVAATWQIEGLAKRAALNGASR
jgi:malonyl-CoA decarboxylase